MRILPHKQGATTLSRLRDILAGALCGVSFAALSACGAADAAPSETTVRGGQQLKEALRAAKGGETILLAPGQYGDIVIRGVKKEGGVTLRSIDANSPAIASSITIGESADIVVRGVAVDLGSRIGVNVGASQRIRLEGLRISGRKTPDGAGIGNGAAIKYSSDVAIVGSQFNSLAHGISIRDVRGLLIEGNDIHNIRADGIHGGGSSDIIIRSNVFRDFFRSPGDHPDAIQLWTTNTEAPARNILVADNLIARGEGKRMQGIFITDQSLGRFPYENVTIRGNVVVGGMYHGITLSSAKAPVIENNLVMAFDDGPAQSWIGLDRSTDAVVRNNQATAYRLKRENMNLQKKDNREVSVARVGDYRVAKKWFSTRPEMLARMPSSGSLIIQ